MASSSSSAPLESADTVATRTAHVQSLLDRLLQNSPIYGFTLSEIKLESVSRGFVTTALTLTETHVNSKGSLHGAVSATIIDFTTGLAIASWDLRPSTGASVDMHISYLSTAKAGDTIRIETTAERVGGSLAFVSIKILKGDDIVTIGQHSKFVRGTAPVVPLKN
ncbi:hypothetical protein DCS_03517 [Drechmeria coniospora]|uniref:Thioesterase domain-containing protein n=1 Tax=Drechmeria coniospora TaxID=98403 RepID=A0A151GHB0_DRECN|nr:hypothetical protein DCS_03517 [Drechmeria coniospora]KYK56517.1 hypothetical protein DCS_03517 [Drechmeria coniospora]ODA76957.1 hypothetical protein RJ55_07474 [Drechmeria coniospora]